MPRYLARFSFNHVWFAGKWACWWISPVDTRMSMDVVMIDFTWRIHLKDWYGKMYEMALVHFVHYNDVIMSALVSRITSLTIAYSIVYSGTGQRKQALCHWPLCGEFTGDRGPVTRKTFRFVDLILCQNNSNMRPMPRPILIRWRIPT